MTYKHLDNWDIQHIKDSVGNTDLLFMIIDDMIEENRDDAYDGYIKGYRDGDNHGYERGYDMSKGVLY